MLGTRGVYISAGSACHRGKSSHDVRSPLPEQAPSETAPSGSPLTGPRPGKRWTPSWPPWPGPGTPSSPLHELTGGNPLITLAFCPLGGYNVTIFLRISDNPFTVLPRAEKEAHHALHFPQYQERRPTPHRPADFPPRSPCDSGLRPVSTWEMRGHPSPSGQPLRPDSPLQNLHRRATGPAGVTGQLEGAERGGDAGAIPPLRGVLLEEVTFAVGSCLLGADTPDCHQRRRLR